jgi:hypothetical protein
VVNLVYAYWRLVDYIMVSEGILADLHTVHIKVIAGLIQIFLWNYISEIFINGKAYLPFFFRGNVVRRHDKLYPLVRRRRGQRYGIHSLCLGEADPQ